ncbi:hypothetical protein ABE039_21850 [Priestia megaterium]|jgi:hypothetical protein
MKIHKNLIPMSPTRFFETFERIRKNISEEKLIELRNTLTVDKSIVDTVKNREYCIYSTINQLAKEVLLKEGVLSNKNDFSPKCTLLKRQIEFIDTYQGDNTVSYRYCTIFSYTEPFKASFTYMGYGKKVYHKRLYEDIIKTFSLKILSSYSKSIV